MTLDPVEITFQFPATLIQLTPVNAEYETGAFTGSGSGTVEGNVIPVDINLAPPRASTSGCEVTDFAGLDFSGDNDIALVQRGTCFFGTKAFNAQNAGAEAVIIFNQGNTPDREGLVVADATSLDLPGGEVGTVTHDIPVVGASFAQGEALAQPGSTAFVEVVEPETRTDFNVIAELPGRNTNNVVMAGAHLDSVTEGPGINDNGSGSAALLETALLMANTIRRTRCVSRGGPARSRACWAPTDYVAGLSQAERDRIALYMNYDMVASPNYIFMVYDADQSTFPAAGVPSRTARRRSRTCTSRTTRWSVSRTTTPSSRAGATTRRSSTPASRRAGCSPVPRCPRPRRRQAIWGGTAGDSFDPCYHQACDTIDNIDLDALDVNSDVIAFAMLTFAYSTESVNGVPGKKVPGRLRTAPGPGRPGGHVPGAWRWRRPGPRRRARLTV